MTELTRVELNEFCYRYFFRKGELASRVARVIVTGETRRNYTFENWVIVFQKQQLYKSARGASRFRFFDPATQ